MGVVHHHLLPAPPKYYSHCANNIHISAPRHAPGVFGKIWVYETMAIFSNPTCHLLLQNTTTSTEVFYRVMERIHALVNVFPYNYSHDLLKDFVLNINSSRAFHKYPSFFMRVITSQLDFPGVPIWYPEPRWCFRKTQGLGNLYRWMNTLGCLQVFGLSLLWYTGWIESFFFSFLSFVFCACNVWPLIFNLYL
ncbi:hypothetical protein Hanom_Chr05g00429681 [Helianthus anomalus]